MKKIQPKLLLLILMLFSFQCIMNGQLICSGQIQGSLSQSTQAEVSSLRIYAEQVVETSIATNIQISLDEVTYSDYLDFYCSDIGTHTIYARATVGGILLYCSSTLEVTDQSNPVPSAQNITVSLNGESSIFVAAASVDAGSYDNCSIDSMFLSQSTFTLNGEYNVVFTVTDPSGNADSTNVVITVIGGEPSCTDLSTTFTTSADFEIWGTDLMVNHESFDHVLISYSFAGPYHESIVAECGTNGQNSYTLYVKAIKDHQEFNCEAQLTIIDNAPPTVKAEEKVYLTLVNGEATLSVEAVDNGSNDHCTDVELSLSNSNFTTEHIGINTVSFTVADMNGNEASVLVTVIVDDGTQCNLGFVNYPDDIVIFDENGVVANLFVDNLQSIYGYSFVEVHPYTDNDCENIIYSYIEFNVQVNNGVGINRIWKCIDLLTGQSDEYVQVLRIYFSSNQALACNDEVIFSEEQLPVTAVPEDFLEGGIYNYANMELRIEDNDGNTIEGNILTEVYLGQELIYEVKDLSTGTVCWGFVIVGEISPYCPLEESIFNPPLASIIVADVNVNFDLLTPDYLSLNYGFSLSEVSVTWTDEDCHLGSISYEDEVFSFANGSYAIVRLFTVIDWSIYNPIIPVIGSFTFTQTINITTSLSEPVCNELVYASIDATGQVTMPGEIFIEGNANYDLLEVSLDNVNFSESVNFDCSNIGNAITVYIHVVHEGNEYNCTSQVIVEDKLAPVVIVSDFTIDLDSEADTYTLQVDDINNGSFDNCGGLTFELSQSVFTNLEWGLNEIELTATDIGGLTASATATITVLINGQSHLLQCISENTVVAEVSAGTEVWGIDFVANSDDFEQVLVSVNLNGPFTESIIVDCGINGSTPHIAYIQAIAGGQQYNCFVKLNIVDASPPVVVAETTVSLTLENGSATLTAEMVDNGSFDNCTDVTLSLDQTLFTSADIGTNTVVLTVTDMNGLTTKVDITVIVNEGNGCSVTLVQMPGNIDIYDDNGTYTSLSIGNLQTVYGYTFAEVHAYTVVECDGIIYTYVDQVISVEYGLKVIRTWTAFDWYTGDVLTHVQVLKLYTSFSSSLVCNDLESISVQNGPITLQPIDVLEGGPYNYNRMTLRIVASDNTVVEGNLITEAYVGQLLTYTVTDTVTNNSCWGNINVENTITGCALDGDDISYPLPIIYVPEFTSSPLEVYLSPEYLSVNYGFQLSEVSVTWPEDECIVAGYSIEDNYFNIGSGQFKIVRTFSIIDWITYNPGSPNVGFWTYTQIIYTGIDPGSLICDFLPRTADIGDCDSGHTLDDDVEWPADLQISDYRIDPSELVAFSLVNVLDSEPSFYNNINSYSATYVDLLIDFTATSVVVGRVWTVTHVTLDLTWTYNQSITVDFSEFDNLVTINTGTNRAMPGVMINENFTTNMQGSAYVDGDPVNSIEYEDDYLNGIHILDYILIQRYILGLDAFSENSVLAADVDFDSNISATDLLVIQDRLLGIQADYNWSFYAQEVESPVSVDPKGAFLAIKSGDVDDNALLGEDGTHLAVGNFVIEDILLNAGENYSVPVYLKENYTSYGVEFRVIIDAELMNFIDVSMNNSYDNFNYHMTEEGMLTIIFSNSNNTVDLGGDSSSPVFALNFEAKQNSLLSLAIDLESQLSFLADSNLELVVLGSEIGDMIGTGTNSKELRDLTVYPNPTTDYLNIDLNNVDIDGSLEVSIFELNGQKLFSRIDSQTIDVSDLNAGMYYYQIKIGDYTTTGKFIVIK